MATATTNFLAIPRYPFNTPINEALAGWGTYFGVPAPAQKRLISLLHGRGFCVLEQLRALPRSTAQLFIFDDQVNLAEGHEVALRQMLTRDGEDLFKWPSAQTQTPSRHRPRLVQPIRQVRASQRSPVNPASHSHRVPAALHLPWPEQ